MDKATYTVEEAARVLGISRGSAYEAVRRGDLPVLKIGKRLLVPRAMLERILNDPQRGGHRRQTRGRACKRERHRKRD